MGSSSRRIIRVGYSWSALLVVLLTIQCSDLRYRSCAQDAYDEYVQEVLEEDQERYGSGDSYYHDDDYEDKLRQEQEDAERRRKEEEERMARDRADRLASERERQFEADLERMNEEQKKIALRQKKKDARVVKAVLKAENSGDYYAVLGIRNWQLRIPPRKFNVGKYSFSITGISLRHTSSKDIRKAYKRRAKAVHPDKNRNGRAAEAFVAVENAASILTNDDSRSAYDKEWKQLMQSRRQKYKKGVTRIVDVVKQYVGRVVWVFRKVLGPFAPAVLIILAILI